MAFPLFRQRRLAGGYAASWWHAAGRGVYAYRRTLLLLALFAASAGVTWRMRVSAAGPALRLPRLEAAPVLATPIPTARQVAGTNRLRIAGSSEIWSAPAVPATPARPLHAPLPLPSTSSIPRTPAGEVDRWILRLATDQQHEMRRALEQMARYEPLIHHALADRGLPRDLLYLALIESGFSPRATSRVGAGGIWQFMPGTARGYGLEISEYVDERRDPIRATHAAVRHLEWLHRQFGSWHLAAAAYNAGDGRVGGVLRQLTGAWGGEERLYWMIRPYLPPETQAYVPKLLAASRIARSPAQYGFGDLAPAAPLAFREVSVPGGVALAVVAEAANVPSALVLELNPHLIRQMTPPGRRWPVRIPAGHHE
jgi:soluble lytic murein transglycosylase-like protein